MCHELQCEQLMEKWLYLTKDKLALSSSVKYRQIFSKHIFPFFQGVPVSELSEELLERFKDFLLDKYGSGPEQLSGGTIRCISILLNQCLFWAHKEHLLPCRLSLDIRLRKNRSVIQVFSSDEQKRLELYLCSHLNLSTAGILFCLYTGLRIGELCALKWSDIDKTEDTLCVSRTVQRLKQEEAATALLVSPPKTVHSMRLIPIPVFLKQVLYPYCPGPGASGYIFSEAPQKPLEPRTMQYRYKKYLKEAGVSYRKFHTLRHTFATRCLMNGMDIKSLSELLGHADVKTTLNCYCHTTLEHKREQINLLTPFSQI